jgi:hypothetical protein
MFLKLKDYCSSNLTEGVEVNKNFRCFFSDLTLYRSFWAVSWYC